MELLIVLALLACPVGMGAMMWWMGRNMNQSNADQAPTVRTASAPASGTVEDLRDEHARLTAEIDQLEREERSPTAGRWGRS